jgi:uncharacterized protein
METAAPDYDDLTQALADAGADMSAAEAHGTVTGMACAPDAATLAHVFFGATAVPQDPAIERLLMLLAELLADTQRRLAGSDFEFEPMLSSTPQAPARVEARAEWARGFLLGLGSGGVRDPRALSGEAAEFLLDVIQIGEAEADGDDDAEQQERDLAEIVEYLRAGVQLLHDELQPPPH